MLKKLSFRNAKRQLGEYLIYLITVTISCALMFGFNSMIFSGEVMEIAGQSEIIVVFIVLFSMIVIGIIGWLISFILRHMLRKRSKEFGMYLLLGIEKDQIVKLFFGENILVGGIAFTAGIFLGGIIFQVIKAFILYLSHEPYRLAMEYSPVAIGLTLLYFFFIYLRSLGKSKKVIRRMQVRDLLYYEKENEEIKAGKGTVKNLVFTGSLILGIAGAGLLIYLPNIPGKAKVYAGMCAVLFFIAFFYGVYLGIASLILGIVDGKRNIKYKNNRVFLMRSFTAQIDSVHTTMFMVTMLLCVAVVTAGLASSWGLTTNDSSDRMAYDFVISKAGDTSDFSSYQEVTAEMDIKETHIYPVYSGEGTVFLTEGGVMYWMSTGSSISDLYQSDTIIRYSDYQRIRAMLGYPEVPELTGEYYVHCVAGLKKEFEEKAKQHESYQIGEMDLSYAGIYIEPFAQYNYDINGPRVILVVPDQAAANLQLVRTIYAGVTNKDVSLAQYNELQKIKSAENKQIAEYYSQSLVESKASMIEMQAMVFAGIILPLYYLAFILVIAAVTVVATLFLSDIKRYKKQYAILKQIGMEKRKINAAIRKQITSYFILPCILPVITGATLSTVFGKAFAESALIRIDKIYPVIGGIIALYLVLYFIYYLASLLTFRKQIIENG